jgi:hypothetical protein
MRDFVVTEAAPDLWEVHLGGASISIHAKRAYLRKSLDWYSAAILEPAVAQLLGHERAR